VLELAYKPNVDTDILNSSETDNLLAFYKRFLLFEDPAEKWSHVVKFAIQHKYQDFLSKPSNTQFISSSCLSNNLVNVLFAYRQSKCFMPDRLNKLSELNLANHLPTERVNYWINIAHIDLYLAQWLTLAEIYWPKWTQIAELDKQDKRIRFLNECVRSLENNLADWATNVAKFEQLLSAARTGLPTDFLPKILVLVEGLTEQFLLPCFANNYGINLIKNGIMIVPAGGANKLVRKYSYWKERIDLPIFCLFDADAQDLVTAIRPNLRANDYIHILAEGEIEDLIYLEFLVESINKYLAQDPLHDATNLVNIQEFSTTEKRIFILDKIWRKKELGKFEKVKFAQFIASQSYDKGNEILSAAGKDMLDKLVESMNL
jgi:hypothetical protein